MTSISFKPGHSVRQSQQHMATIEDIAQSAATLQEILQSMRNVRLEDTDCSRIADLAHRVVNGDIITASIMCGIPSIVDREGLATLNVARKNFKPERESLMAIEDQPERAPEQLRPGPMVPGLAAHDIVHNLREIGVPVVAVLEDGGRAAQLHYSDRVSNMIMVLGEIPAVLARDSKGRIIV